MFLTAEFLMLLVLSAYLKVLTVSSVFESAGDTHATITVFEFPDVEEGVEKMLSLFTRNATVTNNTYLQVSLEEVE